MQMADKTRLARADDFFEVFPVWRWLFFIWILGRHRLNFGGRFSTTSQILAMRSLSTRKLQIQANEPARMFRRYWIAPSPWRVDPSVFGP
jgi:hypothetical protein